MTPEFGPRLGAALVVSAALAGCGVGPGERSEGEATLTVTRDYGSQRLAEATVSDPSESETVIRFLDREAEITTRYGGGFVQSIDGLAGGYENGRNFDWFFFVDGIESPVGSAEREVRAGQRIWWDYRDWTDAMRVPAVVGSWPEPFAQAAADDPLPVQVSCLERSPACEVAAGALAAEDVDAEIVGDAGDRDAMRLLVGTWEEVGRDSAAAQLDAGLAQSGVFARFEQRGPDEVLVALDDHAQPAGSYGKGAGLLAAVRDGESPPTWLVSGTDERGVLAAAEALDAETLADRYAVLITGAETLALPAEAAR